MTQTLRPDLCILGAGSAGLSLAAGAAQLGASVVLIEGRKMGGDCLNYGCVPSKALLAAGHSVAAARRAAAYGVRFAEPEVDFAAVHAHVQGVIDGIAPHDSEERYRGFGCTVLREEASFASPRAVTAGEARVEARNFVIATGSAPLVPPIPGLRETPHLTNETVFGLQARPRSLIVLGGGPIGCELGQAFARLGVKVQIVELASILPRDEPDAAAVVRRSLLADGIRLHEGQKAAAVEAGTGSAGVRVRIEPADGNGEGEVLEAEQLLVALGRRPNLAGLNLEAAGVEAGPAGVKNNVRLRTSNKRVWVAGDAAGRLLFTHAASYHASVLVKNLLFRIPAKVSERAVPWASYTDPELAQVGHTLASARKAGIKGVAAAEFAFAENDRARAEREEEGFVRPVVDGRGRVVGCTIVGAHAGDLLHPWILAVEGRMKLAKLATAVAPYPTRSEASKRAAGAHFTPALFSPRTRRLVRLLGKLP